MKTNDVQRVRTERDYAVYVKFIFVSVPLLFHFKRSKSYLKSSSLRFMALESGPTEKSTALKSVQLIKIY